MKKLVVIGGGFAGSKIAKELENDFETTLIDTKDYFEYTPGVLESITDPACTKEIRILHTSYLKKAQVVIGKVQKISEKHVLVAGRKIGFDYLVIASGSKYSFPFKDHDAIITKRASRLRAHCSDLAKAKTILVIGGGFSGVELAGDITEKYPKKKVIIVHAMDRLLERQPKEVSNYVEKFFRKRKVKIIFNELIKKEKDNVYSTNKGTKIKADMAFLCVGITANSGFMKLSFPKLLNSHGGIDVNEFLQMKGHRDIFVAGDVTGIKEEKTAQSALEHADVIIENLKRMERKKKLKKYHFKSKGMLISLGPHKGIYSKGKFIMKGWIPRTIKSYVQRKQMMGM